MYKYIQRTQYTFLENKASKEAALNTSVHELKIDGCAEWIPINHTIFFSLYFVPT